MPSRRLATVLAGVIAFAALVGATPADGTVHTARALSGIDTTVAQIDLLARDLMERSGIPGMALAIVHDDQMVFAKGYGVRDVDTGLQSAPTPS